MPRFLLMAINGPTEGDDSNYNDWYDKVHAADLMSIDGAVSVRRFKVQQQGRIDKPYVSITEIEGESAEAVMQQLAERASNFPDHTIDRTSSIFLLGEEVTQPL